MILLQIQLQRLIFNTLNTDICMNRPCPISNCRYNDLIHRMILYILHKRPVDLDLIQR